MLFASPPVTATPNDVYTQNAGQRRPRAHQLLQKALCTAPATRQPAAAQRRPRAAALPGGSVYCACHTTASRGPASVYCLPHESQPRASGGHARSSSCRRLCELHLPHDSQLRASARPAAATRAPAPAGGSVYTAPATRQPAAAQRGPRTQQLLQEGVCTAPAIRQPAAGQR